jgi:PadR family transcriptional regulator PadR
MLQQATLLKNGSPMIDPTKLVALRKGLLEFLVLGVVSSDAVYAADIIRRLSTTDFATREGTLYPLLSKMRREGLLDYEWQESAAGPPRKYYRLTAKGEAELRVFREYWASLSELIERLGSEVPCTR